MEKGRLKKLIIPLVLEQLLAVSVGMVDTFMVSKVGEAAVSGVALVDSINLLIIQVMSAFAAGGIVVISQYLGEKSDDMVQSASSHLEVLIDSFSIMVMAIFLIFGKPVLSTLFGKIEPDVMAASTTYLRFTAISFVFWGIYTAGAAILRCYEDTKTAMKVSLLMNLLNVVLNAYFVFQMHLGVLGVAVATLISRAVAGTVMQVILVRTRQKKYTVSKKEAGNCLAGTSDTASGLNREKAPESEEKGNRKKFTLSFDMMKRILAMGIPSGIENGMFHVGKLVLTSVIATLGTTAIAANSISYQIIEFPNLMGVTIGLALVVIVGQDIGAEDKAAAMCDTKYMIKLAYICDWISKAIMFIVAPYVVAAFSLSAEATQTAVLVLRCFSIAALPIWPLSFTLPNALRGAGDVKYSMIASILSMWVGRIIVSYILITQFHLGILGVWIGMFVDWYGRGISFLLRFRSKKWLEKKAV